MQPHPEKVKHEVDQQRDSPGNEKVSPRLPRPEYPNADGNREPKACAERLAHAIEDDFPRELGDPVQGSAVRDEKEEYEDVAGYEGAGYRKWVCAVDEVDGEIGEFEDESDEVVAGWAAPEWAIHVDGPM